MAKTQKHPKKQASKQPPAAVKAPAAKAKPLAKKPAAKATPLAKKPAAPAKPGKAIKPVAASAAPKAVKSVRRVAVKAEIVEDKPLPKSKLKAAALKEYRAMLQNIRDRIVDGISFLAGDNLNRSQRESSGDLSSYSFHMADQGTDNFDREFALNLVSSEQDVLYEIDDALRRIDLGQFGICEGCGEEIEQPRLKALPFAKMCITCKSAAEKGKTRFRPFGPTISQTATSESS